MACAVIYIYSIYIVFIHSTTLPLPHILPCSNLSRVWPGPQSFKKLCIAPLKRQWADLGGWSHLILISNCDPDHCDWSRVVLRNTPHVGGLVQHRVKMVVRRENNDCDLNSTVASLRLSVVSGNYCEGICCVLWRKKNVLINSPHTWRYYRNSIYFRCKNIFVHRKRIQKILRE